jgi:hypothetical protein
VDIHRTVAIAATTRAPPRSELRGRCCSLDRSLFATWLHGRLVRAQFAGIGSDLKRQRRRPCSVS